MFYGAVDGQPVLYRPISGGRFVGNYAAADDYSRFHPSEPQVWRRKLVISYL